MSCDNCEVTALGTEPYITSLISGILHSHRETVKSDRGAHELIIYPSTPCSSLLRGISKDNSMSEGLYEDRKCENQFVAIREGGELTLALLVK